MIRVFLYVFGLCSFLFGIDAELDIVRNDSIAPSIAVVATKNGHNPQLVEKIKKIVQNDFVVSGHFNVIDTNISLSSFSALSMLDVSETKNLDLVLFIGIERIDAKNLIVDAVLYNFKTKSIQGKNTYSILDQSRYPFLAHKIAIATNNLLMAPSIDWMDRFIIFSRYVTPKKSEIVIADYTLSYQKIVVSGGLNVFPKWSNKEQTSFYYTTYDNLLPTLVRQNLYNRNSEIILQSDGMIVCSDIGVKGDKIILTMASNGQPDIYIYDLGTKQKSKVTSYSGIDVGGNFVDNDSKIVFTSDRLGKPNIFLSDLESKTIERLVYQGLNNSQATTFKNWIVYSSREGKKNAFNLYMISTKNDSLKRLTNGGINQFPKFSIDGESLLYIKNEGKKSSLGIVRLYQGKSFLYNLSSGKIQSIDW